MGVKFGTEKGTFGPVLRAKFHPHRCNMSPLWGEKPQNGPLSKLNTGRFALRAMLPVMNTKYTYTENESKHSEMHPVRQNSVQRSVKLSEKLCNCVMLHSSTHLVSSVNLHSNSRPTCNSDVAAEVMGSVVLVLVKIEIINSERPPTCVYCNTYTWWLSSLVVRALELRIDGRLFDSRPPRLVLGWVAIYGQVNHLGISPSPRPTQPPVLCRMGYEYRSKCSDALQLESKAGWLIPLMD